MVGGAVLGGIIASVLVTMTGAFAMAATGPLGFIILGPWLLAQAALSSTITFTALPVWALLGGWLFADHGSSKDTMTRNLGVTLFSDGHPIHKRINELGAALQLPPIKWVGWYEGDEINAFATGMNADNALIAFTQGAIEKLSNEQLDAVMAHELAHVANNDMARMTFARGVQSALTFFLLFRGVQKFARWIFTPTSELELMRLSRSREFWADAIAAELTSAGAMAAALRAIDMDANAPPALQEKYANMMMRGNAHSWYATHPPLEERITAVLQGTFVERLPFLSIEQQISEEGASAH